MARPIRWYDLLTLDHTVCRICFNSSTRPASVAVADSRKPLITHEQYESIRRLPMRSRLSSLQAKRKAALRRHIDMVHPDWKDRVRWLRD